VHLAFLDADEFFVVFHSSSTAGHASLLLFPVFFIVSASHNAGHGVSTFNIVVARFPLVLAVFLDALPHATVVLPVGVVPVGVVPVGVIPVVGVVPVGVVPVAVVMPVGVVPFSVVGVVPVVPTVVLPVGGIHFLIFLVGLDT